MRSTRRRMAAAHPASVPARSRVTVKRTVAALSRSRRALSDIEGQLDALLVALGDPRPKLDVAAPDRLAAAKDEATAALASLAALKALF